MKISKTDAGYLSRHDCEFNCGSCTAVIQDGKYAYCSYFGPNETVNPTYGSCNYFSPGGPLVNTPYFTNNFEKQELGYTENSGKQGFGCKRCTYISFEKRDCQKVDKDSPGDTPGEISPESGCCNDWKADPNRSKMTTQALLVQIGTMQKSVTDIKKADLRKISADEYRRLREK